MKIIVTGAAGFIGFHTSIALMNRGDNVIGVDNLNDYYDVKLKKDRLSILKSNNNFTFYEGDIADTNSILEIIKNTKADKIIHLAAQAGVRYSIENPYAYIQSNILGHLNILEACRHSDTLQNLVYASSSSVYGANDKQPFSTDDVVDTPISLYAATKKSNELMTYCYSHLYGIKATGLRFFTVYGPYGRPDMAYFSFTDAITKGQPIKVFNNGKMKRDFTYIDDIVQGIISALDTPPKADEKGVQHKVYNLGNNKSENLVDFIEAIEKALRVNNPVEKIMMPMQDGDVAETYADITQSQKDLGYAPKTPISIGIPKFVEWFKEYYKLQ